MSDWPGPDELDQPYRELEVQEQQERRRREQARAEMSWKIQPQRSNATALLHRGNCTLFESGGGGFINREPCEICRPETGLAST